jgi:hypothetical protein
MNRIIGMGIGVFYLVIAFGALSRADAGWATGYTDLGFWWTVVAVLLAAAAVGSMVGTWIHTQKAES